MKDLESSALPQFLVLLPGNTSFHRIVLERGNGAASPRQNPNQKALDLLAGNHRCNLLGFGTGDAQILELATGVIVGPARVHHQIQRLGQGKPRPPQGDKAKPGVVVFGVKLGLYVYRKCSVFV